MENVYTLLQPPRTQSRAESPGVSTDRRGDGPQWKKFLVLSPPPKSILDTKLQQPEYGRLWGDVKQSDRLQTTEGSGHAEGPRQPDGRQGDGHAEAATDGPLCGQQRLDGERERTRAESKPTERACCDSRRADKQWTLDRHAQRQIDRKLERQWTTGRHLDRSWSENRSTDIAIDWMWTEGRQPGSSGRKTERSGPAPHLPQRPLPPYTSDWTPSTKQEGDPLRNLDLAALVVGERTLLHMQETPSDRQSQSEGWRSGGGGVSSSRSAPCASKPDPPLQSIKRHLQRLSSGVEEEEEVDPGRMDKREGVRDLEGPHPPIPEKPKTSSYVTFPKNSDSDRHLPPPPVPPPNTRALHGLPYRAASQGDEGIRPQAPVKPRRHRKAMSCDTGTDRDRDNLEKPTNRKPPVKKPRLPQNRNKSLDLSARDHGHHATESFSSAPEQGNL
ncbi:unnamed protein product [Arctogadus glacialis]